MADYVIGTMFGSVRCSCGYAVEDDPDARANWPAHQEAHRKTGDVCRYPWEAADA